MPRDILRQDFTTFSFVATTAPQPIAQLGVNSMIDTIMFSLPTGAANSVFFGSDASVSITSGIEIAPGSPSILAIVHDGRQLYELQDPLIALQATAQCRDIDPRLIPFVVWDVSQIYLVAAANTTLAIGLFKAMIL